MTADRDALAAKCGDLQRRLDAVKVLADQAGAEGLASHDPSNPPPPRQERPMSSDDVEAAIILAAEQKSQPLTWFGINPISSIAEMRVVKMNDLRDILRRYSELTSDR